MSDTTQNSKEGSRSKAVSDDELRRRRISREIVRVESEEVNDEEDEDEEEDVDEEDTQEQDGDDAEDDDAVEDGEEKKPRASKSLWEQLISGGFIASDGAVQYYRYLIAIAVMCFVSIFLTFMSLNANAEYRRKEKLRDELRERSISLREQRLRISQREEVKRMISEEDNLIMVDQDNSIRM